MSLHTSRSIESWTRDDSSYLEFQMKKLIASRSCALGVRYAVVSTEGEILLGRRAVSLEQHQQHEQQKQQAGAAVRIPGISIPGEPQAPPRVSNDHLTEVHLWL